MKQNPGHNNLGLAFLRHAKDAPSMPSIMDNDSILTREQVACWASTAAERIKVEGGITVLLLPRSWAVPASMIAARIAGTVFLPLDISVTEERLHNILMRVKPAFIITMLTDTDTRKKFPSDMCITEIFEISSPAGITERLHISVIPDYRIMNGDTGHIIFTSGSTGIPKGVLLRDAPLMETVRIQRQWSGSEFNIRPSVWALSPGFDASLSDIFCAILGSSPLAVFRPEQTKWKSLADFCRTINAGYADISPSLMRIVPPEKFGLECIVFGGERCEPDTAVKWGSHGRALQAYGPTEAAVCAMMARADSEWIPGLLGRPLPSHEIFLSCPEGLPAVKPAEPDLLPQDREFNRVILTFPGKPDVSANITETEGEIWIAGSSVSSGYLDTPDEPAFGTIDDVHIHRTGDIAGFSDGFLIWKGRNDRRFKRNGIMICPEETERVAEGITGSTAAFVQGRDGMILMLEKSGIIPHDDKILLEEITVRLGRHFRPDSIRRINVWPYLSNGKSDIQKLRIMANGT